MLPTLKRSSFTICFRGSCFGNCLIVYVPCPEAIALRDQTCLIVYVARPEAIVLHDLLQGIDLMIDQL
jgi:hypothetical protein